MGTRVSIGILSGLIASVLNTQVVWAQVMDFGAQQSQTEESEEGVADEEGEMDFGSPPPVDDAGASQEEVEDADALAGIGGDDQANLSEDHPLLDEPPANIEPLPTWSMQRNPVLRNRRFELVPRFSFSMNDQFVSHYGFGGLFNWYITNVLSLGIEGVWFYGNRESDNNFYTSRSFRVTVPINEYWMGWYLNFSYMPLYGKFAVFNRWIVHWDTFITGGLGVTLTRPIAVIDSEFRSFDEPEYWSPNITFSIGLGGRIFLSRWLAIFAELRMYGFPQELERSEVASLSNQCDGPQSCPGGEDSWAHQRANPETWLDEEGEFAVNVMIQVGLSFFLPPTYEYRLPL